MEGILRSQENLFFGRFVLLFNVLVFVANLRQLPFLAALLVLVSTVSCTLPFMLQHRQHGIADAEYLRRVIVPSFLGLTVSVILLSLLGQWMAASYGMNHREAMGMFFNNHGLFFLVMSNFIFVQMILKEAVPPRARRPYWVLLMIPLLLLAVV